MVYFSWVTNMKDIPVYVGVNEECVPEELRGDSILMKNMPTCRIPSMVVSGDTVIAACDRAIFGGDWGYIEIGVRCSKDSGETFGEMQIIFTPPVSKAPLCFDDNASAFAIDPVTVRANDGSLIMLFDFYPECKGLFKRELLVNSTGYVQVNGTYYLRLRDKQGREFTIRENGAVFDVNGVKTNYYVPQNHSSECSYGTIGDMYYSKKDMQFVDEFPPLFPDNRGDKYVGNIFLRPTNDNTEQCVSKHYSKSALYQCIETQAAPMTADVTSYIWMTKSNDNGKTWSQPTDITPFVKRDTDDPFFGVGPGSGICLENGRILIPVYSVGSAFVIYSDDNGDTWHRGGKCENIDECQFVSYSDGTVGCFGRPTEPGNMPYSISRDNGLTWEKIENTLYTVRCQHSCLTVPENLYVPEMDKEYDYIICTCPTGHHGRDDTRTDGYAFLGKVNSDYTVNWFRELKVKSENVHIECMTDENAAKYRQYSDFFAYSCMSVLPDGQIGVLYESYPCGYIALRKFSISDFFDLKKEYGVNEY